MPTLTVFQLYRGTSRFYHQNKIT